MTWFALVIWLQINIQEGVRLSPTHAIQWQGRFLFFQADSNHWLDLSQEKIQAVFAGPLRGSFALATETQFGFLLDQELIVTWEFDGFRTIQRSHRWDIHWVCLFREVDGTLLSAIHELRANGVMRLLVERNGYLRDFDVDQVGRLALIDESGVIWLIGYDNADLRVALPDGLKEFYWQRVFLNRNGDLLSLVCDDQIWTKDLKNGTWSKQPFDLRRHALVRQLTTGQVLLEPRIDPGSNLNR